MLSILGSFFLILPFLSLTQCSVNINSYFQTLCNSSFSYQLPPNNDYIVSDYNFSICSSIIMQSSVDNASILLVLTRTSFYLNESLNLSLIRINLETDYSGINWLGSVFSLGKDSALLIKESTINLTNINYFNLISAESFFLVGLEEIKLKSIHSVVGEQVLFNLSNGGELSLNGFYFDGLNLTSQGFALVKNVSKVAFQTIELTNNIIINGFSLENITEFSLLDSNFNNNSLSSYIFKISNQLDTKSTILLKGLSFSQIQTQISFNNTSLIQIINANSSIFLNDSVFSQNFLSQTSLISITNNSNFVQVTNCTVSGNENSDNYSPFFYFEFCDSVIFNLSRFLSNNAENPDRNGSTLIKILSLGSLALDSSEFSNNYAFSSTSVLEINNRNVNTNEVNVSISISNCSFFNNSVNYSESSSDGLSGATIYLFTNGQINLSHSNFTKNSIFLQDPSLDLGGTCIFCQYKDFSPGMMVNSCIFEQNEGFAMSSCLFFRGGYFSLSNSIFQSNSIKLTKILPAEYSKYIFKKGSNIYLNVLSVDFENCSFDNAFAVSGASFFILLDDIFLNSTPTQDYKIGQFNFSTVLSTRSESIQEGGSIQIDVQRFFPSANFTFSRCVFSSSVSTFEGGVMNLVGTFYNPSTINFSDSFFASNRGLKGGVISNFLFKSTINYKNVSFSNNLALDDEYGGGVFYQAIYDGIFLNNCSFLNNYAAHRASIVYLLHGKYFDQGSVYLNNTSGVEAGMIILLNEASLQIQDSFIILSLAQQEGGFAIAQSQTTLNLSNCVFGNISSPDSAFLYSAQDSYVYIHDSILANFSSFGGKGKIVFVDGTDNFMRFDKCLIKNWNSHNKSHFELRSTTFYLENSQIIDSDGLFLVARLGTVVMDSITIINYNCLSNSDNDFCLFYLQNTFSSLNSMTLQNITLTNRQTLIKSIKSSINVTFLSASTISIYLPFEGNLLYENFLFFILESNYSFISGFVYDIDVTAFQIILSSGVFQNVSVMNPAGDAKEGQFISCFICWSLELSQCYISGMKSDIAPVLQINDLYNSFFYQTLFGFDKEQNRILYIHDSVFVDNVATLQGGAFYILDSSILIENCKFVRNSAKQGGAIYFNCTDFEDDSICQWKIQNSSFINNSASLRGGAIHWLNRKPPDLDQNYFENNFASQGSSFSSNPIKLELMNSTQNVDFTSGYSNPNATLYFLLLDAYDQTYKDVSSLCYLTFDKNFSNFSYISQKFVGNQFTQIQNGGFSFNDFNIISDPGKDANLLVFSDAITEVSPYLDKSSAAHKNINNQYFYAVSIHVRNCQQGEIYRNESNICFPCPDGTYSFDPHDTICSECPANAICLKNKPFMVKKGYWRISQNTSILYRCSIKKAGCIGGTFDQQCEIGYTGPLCSACLYNDTEKYFNSFGGCAKCGSSNTFLILISSVILLAGMVGLIFFSIKDSETFIISQDLKEVLVTVLINILINYSQLFSIISNIDIKWPEFFSSSSSSSSSPTSITDFIGIIECTIANFAHNHKFSIFYVEMVMMAFLFFGMLIGNLLFWLIFKLLRKKCKKKPSMNYSMNASGQSSIVEDTFNLKNNIILTYIAIYVLMLQPLLNFFTKGFSCIEVGNEDTKKHFLKVAPAIECWEETHLSLIKNVIVPFLLIFIIPPPVYMIYYVAKNSNSQNKDVIQRLFMVTVGYKKEYCYWEFVILLKKIILMYLSIFIRDEPVICVLTLLFVLLVFCNLHLLFNPYQYEFLNKLIMEQYVALFICYSVFLYFSYTDSKPASMFLIVIMFFANIIFFGHWAVYFYKYFKKSLNNLSSAIKKTKESMKQITHSALKRLDNRRKRDAIVRSQSTLSKQKFTPRGSKCIPNPGEDGKRILRTTPGKSQVGSQENCDVVEKPFISERKADDSQVEKFEGMLIIHEEK